jgi:hypothetical protein
MRYRHPSDFSPDEVRSNALASAIVLRDCSLRVQTSNPTRRACRVLMREQAIKWRLPPASENGATQPH